MTRTSATDRRVRPVALALIALLVPIGAFAHAVVYPRSSAPGAYEKYVLRVPNEKGVSTTKVELTFPTEVRVISFADVPGWTVQAITDSAQRIIGAVWIGTLEPHRFVELPFIAVNPQTEARLVWPAYQTYADGERVAWTGPEDGPTPASVTMIGGLQAGADSSSGVAPAPWIAILALVVGLISLGTVLRDRNRPAVRD